MRRLLFSLLAVVTSCILSYAAETYDIMYLHMRDGSVQEFGITRDMILKSNPEKFIIITGGYRYEFPRSQVSHIKYGNRTSYVHAVEEETPSQCKLEGKNLLLSSIDGTPQLIVCTIDGKVVIDRVVDSSVKSVSLSSFNPGIYLVTLNGKTDKIILR
ncbi:MAG: T9SS type A sorting domain-containing protein [Bacteroidales bacterium]|nr:T9SS type A sorting domain-containing protein [Bacteroidales bacterium]MCF0178050.1 T9SS type A sorting domain-containing protein [Bacteroidales bacterium]